LLKEDIEENTFLPAQLAVFFLSFLSEISYLVSMFLSLEWRAADHVFIASFQREQLALWKERKEPHHPLKNWKEIKHEHKIKIRIWQFPFYVFFTANQ
jgi:hypothetical protein